MKQRAAEQHPADGEEISYQTFGEHFIRYLVTVPRLQNEIAGVLDATIEGSAQALPKDLLVASYRFKPNDLHVLRHEEDDTTGFTLELRGVLTLTLRVMGMPVPLPLQVKIDVHVDVRTFAPLTIKLQPRRVRSRDVTVNLQIPRELRALPTGILDRVNPLVIAVRENIVRQVNHQITRPELQQSATIDVLALANGALGESGDVEAMDD